MAAKMIARHRAGDALDAAARAVITLTVGRG
jgi:hypothetical protein